MDSEERLVAERTVEIPARRDLTVRISQHAEEEFWRVDVTDVGTSRDYITTTVPAGDSFLMNLISDAVSGEPVAWRHLAQWGHDSLSRPGSRGRLAAYT